MATNKTKEVAADNYSADDIKHLSPRDALRLKTAMYIGSTDEHGLFTCVREPADNVLDEALAGFCTRGEIVAKSKTEFWISDNGRGMPVGMMEIEDPVSGAKSKIPALQAITSLLHAGGKIEAGNGAYKASRGCFTGDTKIKFPNGESESLSKLYTDWTTNTKRCYDIIILDRDTEKLVVSRIIDVILSKHVDNITRVHTSRGGYVDCTPDHKFYVNTEVGIVSTAAADLQPGTRLVTSFIGTEYTTNLMGSKLTYTEQGTQVDLAYDRPRGQMSAVRYEGTKIEDTRVTFVESINLASPIPVFDLTIDHPSHNFFVQLAGTHDSDKETHVLVSNSHAIGQKATNFLSKYFTVTTFSAAKKGAEKQWYKIAYVDGKLSEAMKKCPAPKHPVSGKPLAKGTVVEFDLNTKFFTAQSFPGSLLVEYLKIASYFTPGFTWTLSTLKGSSKVFKSERGVLDYLDDYKATLKDVASLKEDSVMQISSGLFDIALDFTNADGSHLKGFTNGLLNSEGGSHVNSTLNALLKAITPFAKKNQAFSATELREGLVGLVNVKLSAPRFTSQVKVRLDDERAEEPLRKLLLDEFTKFFKKNKALAELICERCTKLKDLKTKFLASKAVVTAINKVRSKGFPAKALSSPNCKPDERELYIVEGDSAKGPVTAERDDYYQEALPIRGKITNAHRAKPAAFFASEEVISLLAMIGFDPKSPDPISKIRVSKIIFLTDADADGDLAYSTKIKMVDGTTKSIGQLAKQWDKDPEKEIWVWGHNKHGELIPTRAYAPMETCRESVHLELTFDDGTKVKCTKRHSWPVNNLELRRAKKRVKGILYTSADRLQIGDSIPSTYFSRKLKDIKAAAHTTNHVITKIREVHTKEEIPYYCMSVPETGNYLIEDKNGNGILTGNCHISVLLLAMIHRYLPDLLDRGMVYVADIPEYMAEVKGKPIYADSKQEMHAKLEKLGAKNATVKHYKGLGEMESVTLRALALDPETRRLIRVTRSNAPDADAAFVATVSGDASTRRTLLGI